MSLITIEEFEQLKEDYPELAQLITFTSHYKDAEEELIADTSGD